MPLEGLSFAVKTLATFEIIYATDPLLQNMTVDNAELRAPMLQNQGTYISHALSLKRSR